MKKITGYPSNKKVFIDLKDFCKEIIKICEKIELKPIAYGSLAYFAYIRDKKIKVNDIDFLVPEIYFPKLISILKKNKIKYHYSDKWHTLIISKGKLNIDFDSIEFWQKNLPIKTENFDFNGLPLNIICLNSLIKIYKKASEVSSKAEENKEKFEALKNLPRN